jgi:hypothetical protein
MTARRPGLIDPACALLLAVLLCAAWSVQGWPALAAFRLPDTDDVVRLQQIRDWLGGQAFGDLAQHRLGPAPGLEMHWSRLPDLVPALVIRLGAPLFGRHAAELAAVIAWPALLLAATLWLVARIARRAGAPAPVAMLVAALAFPASTLFAPGRIDHHGLQMVLALLLVERLLAPATRFTGAIAGLAVAASLAIGLETAPLLATGSAVLLLDWIAAREGAEARLLGFGAALVAALLLAGALLRTRGWDYPACDGFDRQLWQAASIMALVPLALALTSDWLETPRARLLAALALGGVAFGVALVRSPACLHPYGAVDPLLARAWLGGVGEAQPLLAAGPADAIGYAGLMLAGIAAAAVPAWRTRHRAWTVLLAFQVTALFVTFAQLRGAYAGALLAAPALAAMIGAARGRGTLPLLGAWIVSAGILYPLLGKAIPQPVGVSAAAPPCDRAAALGRLDALPPGVLLTSIDLGAYALAATPHRILAAPYHRNTAGNRALLAVLQGSPAQAEATVRRQGINYLAFCPADLVGGGFGGQLGQGHVPRWLAPLPAEGMRLYRVVR